MVAERSNHSSVESGYDGNRVRGRETTRLRLLFLIPLGMAILAIIVALSFALHQYEQQSVQKGVLKIRASAYDFYEESIHYDARALRAVMDTLLRDSELHAALKQRDRQLLLRKTATLFSELKRDYAITHFYFTGTDRVNLLRVHAPQRHGDVINRLTTLNAEKSGTTSYGVELGPLGTFTLRLVTPWYDEQTRQLIGYVELGMEIDRVLQQLRDYFGVEVFVLINKDALDREKWENGMRTLGRSTNWERFSEVVLGSQTSQSLPPPITARLTRAALADGSRLLEVAQGGFSYRMTFLPLQDMEGNEIAQMVLLADVSQELDVAMRTVVIGSLTALLTGMLLFGFFHWQVGVIGRRIEHDELELEQLATHDGLTGLFNQRTFYKLLEDESKRSQRFKNSVALLMLDIDHFKAVNDTYGHPAGDAILRGISDRLAEHVRVIDRVCRYGGEEFAIILPETGAGMHRVAERLRVAIERQPFDIGTGKHVSITVSIGAAAFPDDADSVEALVASADAGLYAAKEGGRNRVCVATEQ